MQLHDNNRHNNWFRISQIKILKNFIETKINFSPSPLWFSKSVLWVLAPTFYDSSPKPSLLIQQHEYTQEERKKKLYNRSFWHNQLIQWYSCAGIRLCSRWTLCQSKTCCEELIHIGFWPLLKGAIQSSCQNVSRTQDRVRMVKGVSGKQRPVVHPKCWFNNFPPSCPDINMY